MVRFHEALLEQREKETITEFIESIGKIKVHNHAKDGAHEIELVQAWHKIKPVIEDELAEEGKIG